ncbi:MAG: DUF5107 domain-containing protein [Bacteroidales bacterium]
MQCFFLASAFGVIAQKAVMQEKIHSLNSYPFSDPDPFGNTRTCYISVSMAIPAKAGKMDWNMIEGARKPVRPVIFRPQVGGKVWGAVEKSTGKEFYYFNHAVKFRDVAMRGAWTSGGIEFNFGLIGHAPSCSSPVDFITAKT